ncbi:MAG TPA: low affinity iron permease family protein [Candidatus Saccharimonadales bacterium]|jgi:low affinity Fe/Cu permease|nr:low affinity iron permease family protein [Candidatus Saccharimonadales bacterium]
MKEQFHKVSIKVSKLAGSMLAFGIAISIIVVWLLVGPLTHYSNTWLLTINTITDVVIFLMVFSIQNTQVRDSKAIQLKLDELIIADKKARNAFIGLESLTDDELTEIDDEFEQLLKSLKGPSALHKLHKKIDEEKAQRFSITRQAGKIVGSVFSPFTSTSEEKK